MVHQRVKFAAKFDTLKFANTLKAAGVPDKQAEAVALSEVLEVNLKDLVTKEDMRHELRDLEQRLIIKLAAILAFAIGLVQRWSSYFDSNSAT